MATAQHIIQQLVPGLEAASEKQQFLKSIVDKHPYFAAAQLAYVKELVSTDTATNLAKQKAALVWHPLVLEQLILVNDSHNTRESIASENIDERASTIDIGIEASNLESSPSNQSWEQNIEEETTTDNIGSQILENRPNQPLRTQELSAASVMDLAAALENPIHNTIQEEKVTVWDEREVLETSLATEMNLTANEEQNSKSIESIQSQDELSTEKLPSLKDEETVIKPQAIQDNLVAHNSDEASYDTQETLKKPEVIADEPLIFEPLHTSDYFASQGIKLTDEQVPIDKLGKQLKSFTEWLQTMKSVHPVKIDLKTSFNQEVTTLAEKSNEEEDIITESMAVAYIAQGKPQKAADVYEKLKLLYPHKSAYFAAELLKL